MYDTTKNEQKPNNWLPLVLVVILIVSFVGNLSLFLLWSNSNSSCSGIIPYCNQAIHYYHENCDRPLTPAEEEKIVNDFIAAEQKHCDTLGIKDCNIVFVDFNLDS